MLRATHKGLLEMKAPELFEHSIRLLNRHYSDYRFFTERDVVWTVQTQLIEYIEQHGLPFRVFNDYGLGSRRLADLVILDNDSVEVAVEFKYEPSRSRKADMGGDIPASKFPVVDWNEVKKDVDRVQDFVRLKQSNVAYSVFIDEGSAFNWRDAPSGSEWIRWRDGISVLWSRQGDLI